MFEKSIPGQSLTNSPENSYAWEKPPQYTSVKEAREAIFLNLLEPKTLKSVQDLMITETPENTIAEIVLTDGFRKGKFSSRSSNSFKKYTFCINNIRLWFWHWLFFNTS